MKGLRLVTPISCILGSLMIFILNSFCCWVIASLYVGFVFFVSLSTSVPKLCMEIESHMFLYLLASLNDLMARKRCTAVWLTVQTGMAVNAPPIVSVQKVLRTLGSGLKLMDRTTHHMNIRYNSYLSSKIFHVGIALLSIQHWWCKFPNFRGPEILFTIWFIMMVKYC